MGWQLFGVDQLSEWSAWNVGSAIEHYPPGIYWGAICRTPGKQVGQPAVVHFARPPPPMRSIQRIAARLARHSELLRSRGQPPSYPLGSLSPGVTGTVIGVGELLRDQPTIQIKSRKVAPVRNN